MACTEVQPACIHTLHTAWCAAGSKALIRRSDGILVSVATSPYPLMIYDMIKRGQWEKATRLCRFIKVRGWAGCHPPAVGQVVIHDRHAAVVPAHSVHHRHAQPLALREQQADCVGGSMFNGFTSIVVCQARNRVVM
jgi:hypothetical protein